MVMIRSALGATLITFLAVYTTREYLFGLAIVMVAYSFFWNAVLPQFEAVTLAHLGQNSHRYSRIRVWGSIGFVITTVVIGVMRDVIGIDLLPLLIALLFMACMGNSLLIAEPPIVKPNSPIETRVLHILQQPKVLDSFV